MDLRQFLPPVRSPRLFLIVIRSRIFAAYGLAFFSGLLSPSTVLAADTLTIRSCIDIALRHSPQTALAQGAEQAARAAYETARASLLPQLSLQSSLTDNQGAKGPADTVSTYSAGLQAQQLLLDFGKAGTKAKGAGKQWSAAEADAQSARQTVALNAEVAYVNLVVAQASQRVNQENVRQMEAHLAQARIFLEAGRGVRFNVVKAEVDASNARLLSLKGRDAAVAARLQLQSALGQPLADSLVLADSTFGTADVVELDSALSAARRCRPDLAAARLRVEAALSLVRSSTLGRLPAISASGGYSLQTRLPSSSWSDGWNAGLNLTYPFFQGGALQAAARQARSNVTIAQANMDALEQSALIDVEQQVNAVKYALERAGMAQQSVDLAQIALSLAQERYRLGNGSSLEMTDAEWSLSNARTTLIQAQADCRIAQARLRRAMGMGPGSQPQREVDKR